MPPGSGQGGEGLAVGLGWHLWEGILAGKKNKLECFFPPPFPSSALSFEPVEGNWWATMLCAGFSLRPFVACFLLKSEMLERDHYSSCLAWPLLPCRVSPFVWLCSSHTVLCWNKVQEKTWIPRRKAWYFEWDVLEQTVWISATCLFPLLRCCEMSVRHCLWDGSETAMLGQKLPWDVNYPTGHLSYPLFSQALPSCSLS